MPLYFDSLSSEWLKTKRSASQILVWAGSFIIPFIVIIGRLDNIPALIDQNASRNAWQILFARNWQFMGFFLLPLGVILATSLVTQVEFRNNTWRQLHATPQPLQTIFWAKFTVIIIMLIQFFILFNIGIYLTGALPALLIGKVHYPPQPFPLIAFLRSNAWFFIDCLPIVALQFLLSLQCRNVLIPLGIGLGLYVASMMALMWRFGYIVPYVYCALNFQHKPGATSFHAWAIGWFALFTIAGYIMYLSKKDRSC